MPANSLFVIPGGLAQWPGVTTEVGIAFDSTAKGVSVFDGTNKYVFRPDQQFGDHWYVAQSDYGGSDSNSGTTAASPWATMDKVFDNIGRGDFIHVYGEISEGGLVTPQGVTDVTVIGEGTRPRHGNEGVPLGPKSGAAEWSSGGVADEVLEVTQQGWRFIDLTFDGHASFPIVKLTRNANGETLATGFNAGHAEFIRCVFVGPSTYGIQDSGGNPNIGIFGCNFYNFSTSGNIAIGAIAGAGVGFLVQWQIVGNRFQSNLTDINLPGLMGAEITHNHFKLISNITGSSVTNTVAYATSAGGRDNWIALNHMHAAQNHNGVNARFVPGTNDMFAENYWSDIAEYGEPAS